jgi:hypothetical protein
MIRTLSNSSPEAKDFLKFIREELHNNKVKLAFSRTRKVRFSHGVYTAGYFLEPTPRKWGILRVGTGNRKPINILQNIAHEYVHFIQWREGDNAWTKGDGDLIEGSSYVELEKRTEKDAIALLRDWGIPANYNAMRMRSKAYIAHLRRTET